MFIKYFIQLLKRFNKGFKKGITILFLMAVLSGFMELLGIAMVFPLMFVLTSSDSKEGKFILDFFVKIFPETNHMKIALILAVVMISIFIFKNIFMIYFIKIQNIFIRNWSDYVNSIVVKKLLYAPYQASKTLNYGDKIILLNSSVRDISLNFLLRVIIFFANGVVTLSILLFLFYKFTLPAFLSTVFILIYTYLENSFFKAKAKKLGKINLELSSKFGSDSNFVISSIKEIIVSNKKEYFSNYLTSKYDDISDTYSKEVFYGSCPLYVTEIGVIISFLIMAASIFLTGETTKEAMVSSLAVIALMVLRLVPQLNKVLISMYMINVAKPKVIWFLDKLDEISKFEFDNPIESSNLEFKDKIKLQNVFFEYENKNGIFDINLEIKKGEFVGIIGLSGAGKSTLADVLSGIYKPKSGSIFVDDVLITKDNLVSFQKKISFLPQESHFLDDTVLKNVAWGIPDDKIDTKKAKEALIKAGLDVDINSKIDLSLGQKKRVALARAYYADFEILILDEATASLDVRIENLVMENIIKQKGEKTIIAIAHRLNTLKKCDKIIFMADGKIKDTGTFEELRERMPELDKMLKISSFD